MRQLIWYNPNTADEQPGQFTRTDEEKNLSGWFWVVHKIAGTIQPAAIHNGQLHLIACNVPLNVEQFHVLAPLEMDLTTRQADLAIAEAHLAGTKQITIDAPDLTTRQLPFSPLVDIDDDEA